MQLTTEQEKQEMESSHYLASVVNVDSHIARRMLRKHNGDVAKAADAILAGDLGADVWESQHRTTPDPVYSQDNSDTATPTTSSIVTPVPSLSVIDLTADDEDLTRAIQMSMEDSSQAVPKFTPSQRAPHPEWQMVRSNAPVSNSTTTTHEDHSLNEAIQASLKDFTEDADVCPVKESVREGGRPIALRPSVPSLAYAALVLQAMYFVPQVRSAVADLRLPEIDPQGSPGDSNRAMWNLIELFVNMDLAQLSALVDVELLPSLELSPLAELSRIGGASSDVITKIGKLIEDHMEAQSGNEEIDHLFSFTYSTVKLIDKLPHINHPPLTGSVVSVDFGGDSVHNDLISCLTDNLNKFDRNSSWHDVIVKPSEVCAFHLRRAPIVPGHAKASPDPFVFPKSIFLDRFLFHNLEFTNDRRELEQKIIAEIKELTACKATLTRFNDRDTLRDLGATIHYYQHVANAGDDPDRQRLLKRTATHLQDITTMVMGKVEDIDNRVEGLQAELNTLYDCPELQQYQYDLRAVLVHTGFPGRKQIYSYVQDIEGVWWKTVDHEVTGVPEETVLTDPAGLHFGSGPYMIFYSRHLTDEQLHEPLVWPNIFSECVEENNKNFLAALHPELEIFSRISPERGLDATQAHVEREGQPVSRQNSRAMGVAHD